MNALNTKCPAHSALSDFGLGKLDDARADTELTKPSTNPTVRGFGLVVSWYAHGGMAEVRFVSGRTCRPRGGRWSQLDVRGI